MQKTPPGAGFFVGTLTAMEGRNDLGRKKFIASGENMV
jgi:hypothetical protein